MTMVANEEKTEIGFKSTNNGSKKLLLTIIVGILLITGLCIGAFIFFTQSQSEVWKIDEDALGVRPVNGVIDLAPPATLVTSTEVVFDLRSLLGPQLSKYQINVPSDLEKGKCSEPAFGTKQPVNSNWKLDVEVIPMADYKAYFYEIKISQRYIEKHSQSIATLTFFGFSACDPNDTIREISNNLYTVTLPVYPISNEFKPYLITTSKLFVLKVYKQLSVAYYSRGGTKVVLSETTYIFDSKKIWDANNPEFIKPKD